MIRQKKYNIAETNIALLGSEYETKARHEASTHEEAWQGAGREEGIQIWRVEKFKIKAWPKADYGKFYDGDSYIILKTYKKNNNSDECAWDIHYWLGAYSSQDEMGTAAYKTVELDDYLNKAPVEYREIQDHESRRFLSLFPNGVQYLSGGVDSGFRHVGPEKYEPRLLHVKGRRNIRVEQVPLSRDQLNSGDVFIVDAGMKIYVFLGKECNRMERDRGIRIARSLDDSRGGKPEVYIIGEGEKSDEQYAAFWAFFPGGEGPIAPASAAGSDEDADRREASEHKLFRLSDAGGALKFEKVAEGGLNRSLLDSSDVFIVDIGEQIFVWVGKNSSPQERRFAMKYGQDYMMQANRPLTLPITKLNEGNENEDFFSYVKIR